MNTKEAIEFLERRISYGCHFFPVDMNDLLEVVKQLKEGEKHQETWEKFKKEWVYILDEDAFPNEVYSKCRIDYLMEKFKQKYFPEPVDDVIEIINLVTGIRFDVTEFWKELDDRQRELFKKCFVKEGD